MKISWLILTHNRADIVDKSLRHNVRTAGASWDEIVYVDNGSDESHALKIISTFHSLGIDPDVMIHHKENLGVAKGYNRAMALASGTHMVITGCDRLMPGGWLKTFKNFFEEFPRPSVACMWEKLPEEHRERVRGVRVEGPRPYTPALPIGARFFSRQFLTDVGYLREDFGLYGWEDVEWAERAHRRAELNFYHPTVVLPPLTIHLGTEGVLPYDGKDPEGYHAFKKREAEDPRKRELFEKCRREGFPYYSPF